MQVFFLFFCTFSSTIQEPFIFGIYKYFFASSILLSHSTATRNAIINDSCCRNIYFRGNVLLAAHLYRRKEKARHLLMSCSFFLVCHWEVFLVALQFVIIYKAGECSSEEEVYILIGVYRRKTILGGNGRRQLNCNNNQSCRLT